MSPLRERYRGQELAILIALAEIERECAAACEAGAQRLPLRYLRGELLDLRNDHLRHLETLNQLIAERGGALLPKALEPMNFPAAGGALAPERVLTDMLRREHLGAAAYENALLHPWDRPSRAVLDVNAWEQQRHIRLLEHRARHDSDSDNDGAPTPARQAASAVVHGF